VLRVDKIGIFQGIVREDNFGLTVYSEQLMKSGHVVLALRGLFYRFQHANDITTFDLDQTEFHLDNLHWFGTKLRSHIGNGPI